MGVVFLRRGFKRSLGRSLWVLGICCGVVFAHNANAQTVPSTVEPGRLQQQFQEPTAPKSVLEPVVPETDSQVLPPEQADQIKLTLSGLTFEGVTVYSEQDLLPLYENLLGQDISLSDVYAVANAITAKYRNDGYVLSRAVVPAQRIKNGIVHIRVIEGYIDKVSLDGDYTDARGLVQQMGDKITQSRPVKMADIERYLLLINDLPGMTAKSVLRPSAQNTGASELVLQIAHKPLDASLSQDNAGSPYAGTWRSTVTAGESSVLGLSERTRVRLITADTVSGNRRELRYGDLQHSIPLNAEGTTVSLTGSLSTSEPGHTLKVQEVKSRSSSGNVSVSHPFIRSRAENLSISGGARFSDSKTYYLGSLLSHDQIRALDLSGSYDFVDAWKGITLVAVGVSQGLDVLGARKTGSVNLTRADGHSNFTKYTLDASRLQNIYGGVSVLVAVTGQYSRNQLFSGEEFGVGGTSFGRGYDSSEITGDHGAAGKVELQYAGSPKWAVLKSYQAYAFYDIGGTVNIDDTNRDMLASTGLGVRFDVTSTISGSFEYAQPLTKRVGTKDGKEDQKKGRVLFNVGVRF